MEADKGNKIVISYYYERVSKLIDNGTYIKLIKSGYQKWFQN